MLWKNCVRLSARSKGCVSDAADRHTGFWLSVVSGSAAVVLFGYPRGARARGRSRRSARGSNCARRSRSLRAGAGATLRCRIGIATGMAIISDLREGSASGAREIVGDAADLAVQVRLSAQPDIVTIRPATRRLIGALFDCVEGFRDDRLWRPRRSHAGLAGAGGECR